MGNDPRGALQPFSVGRNLSFLEMRFILTKALYNCDLELVEAESEEWLQQKVFVLWERDY